MLLTLDVFYLCSGKVSAASYPLTLHRAAGAIVYCKVRFRINRLPFSICPSGLLKMIEKGEKGLDDKFKSSLTSLRSSVVKNGLGRRTCCKKNGC